MAKMQDMMAIARKWHIDHEMGQVVGGKHILYVFQAYVFLKTFVVMQMRTQNLFSLTMRVKRTRRLPSSSRWRICGKIHKLERPVPLVCFLDCLHHH